MQEITKLKGCAKIFGNGPAKRNEMWRFSRPNASNTAVSRVDGQLLTIAQERMRFLKYVGGEYFRPHSDGSYERDDRSERSYFTLHLYLKNSGLPSEEELGRMSAEDRLKAAKQTLEGGATTFHNMSCSPDRELEVMPRNGRSLLFRHRDLFHSGANVLQGTKYTMRTGLMYFVGELHKQDKEFHAILAGRISSTLKS